MYVSLSEKEIEFIRYAAKRVDAFYDFDLGAKLFNKTYGIGPKTAVSIARGIVLKTAIWLDQLKTSKTNQP